MWNRASPKYFRAHGSVPSAIPRGGRDLPAGVLGGTTCQRGLYPHRSDDPRSYQPEVRWTGCDISTRGQIERKAVSVNRRSRQVAEAIILERGLGRMFSPASSPRPSIYARPVLAVLGGISPSKRLLLMNHDYRSAYQRGLTILEEAGWRGDPAGSCVCPLWQNAKRSQGWNSEKAPPPASVRWSALLGTGRGYQIRQRIDQAAGVGYQMLVIARLRVHPA